VLLKEKQQLLMVIDRSEALLEVQKVLSNWLVSSAGAQNKFLKLGHSQGGVCYDRVIMSAVISRGDL
jgi:hypothetical protein